VITPATIGDIEVPGSIDLDVSGGTGQLTFEWTDENGMVVSTMEDLTDSGSGDFTLTITDENGCQVMQTYTVPLVTGTNELALLRKWEVYPNPAKEVLNLRMELETVQSGWLELYHIQGKQILRKQLSEQRNYQIDLNVSPFPAGIYLLMVKMDGQIKTEKIIIE
ncbi:MAG: T9SS type A sorting domain-containing protein, partial [Saprospiraceae bacterium]|nr:T9SS type A sorting domain-containing protein [Saprospiraceae bacterium]